MCRRKFIIFAENQNRTQVSHLTGGITPRIDPNFGQHARMQECRFRAFMKFQTFLQVCTNCKITQGRLLTMLSKNFTDIRSDAFTQIIRHFNS